MDIGQSNGSSGTNGTEKLSPQELFADSKRVQAAINDSLREVRILHKKMGVPLVGSRDGKLVSIAPEDIQIDEVPLTSSNGQR